MQILPVPCLKDNFAYLLICPQSGQTGIVDPSEAAPVLEALAQHQLEPVAILNTHHHWDHTGGNQELKARYPQLRIYGHASDRGRIAAQSEFLEHGARFQLGALQAEVFHNPGHTSGAISYRFEEALFTGDTLFAAGCGRIFEGSPAQMCHSLNAVIGEQSDNTRLFFGHEYTLNNLRFALAVEPDNAEIKARFERVSQQRQAGQWTTPSTLAEERQSNPFLRCHLPAVQAAAAEREPGLNARRPEEVFRVLRAWKDQF